MTPLPIAVYFVLPFITFGALVLWVACGFWCERNVYLGDSYIMSAVGFVAYLTWAMVMVAGLLLFLGSWVPWVYGLSRLFS